MPLHTSNLQNFDLARLDGAMLPMSDTRALYGNLNGSQAQLKSALVALKEHTLYVWAPDNNRMAMIMTSLSKLMQEEIGSWRIHFVVMYQPMPGCEKSDGILELWTPPLLHNNYSHMVKNMEFFQHLMRCVTTGPVSPMYHLKSLAIFTVASEGLITPAMFTAWRQILFNVAVGHSITIDMHSDQQVEVQQFLPTAGN